LIAETGKTLFELQATPGSNGAALTVALGGFASVSAASVVVQYASGTSVASGAPALTVGGVSYQYSGAIASGTVAFALKGMSAAVSNYVTLTGDVGFKKVGSQIVATGSGLTARLEASGSVYAQIAGASFGLIAETGKTLFELQATPGSNGAALTVALGGFASVSAASVVVQYASGMGVSLANEVAPTLSVGGVNYQYSGAIADGTVAFALKGMSAAVSNYVTLTGDVGFKKVGSQIVATGSGLTARLEASGSVYAQIAGASFGLIADDGKTVFELKATPGSNGAALTVALGGFASVSAASVVVQYASGTSVASGAPALTVGGVSYQYSGAIADGTVAFALKGISAAVSNYVTLTGDVGFRKNGTQIVATGSGLTARLEASDTVYAQITGASFGLIAETGKTVFELQATPGAGGAALTVGLGGFASMSAASVVVQYASGTSVASGAAALNVGGVNYQYSGAIADGTVAFALKGLSAAVSEFVTLSGDVGFKKVGTQIVATGSGVTAKLAAGNDVYIQITGASFGLVAEGSGVSRKTAFELQAVPGTTAGAPALTVELAGFAQVSASKVLVQYANGLTVSASSPALTVGGVSYAFSQTITDGTTAMVVQGLNASVGGFAKVGGDYGFKVSGSQLLAVADNASASLESGSAYVRLIGAKFGLRASSGQVAFELSNGTLEAALGDSVEFSATGVTVQYTSSGAAVASGETVTVGGVNYVFTSAITANTQAFKGQARLRIGSGLVLASGAFAVSRTVQTGVSLTGVAGPVNVRVLAVELSGMNLFVGAGGVFNENGSINIDTAVGFDFKREPEHCGGDGS
jgi:hypothetical protein